MPVTQAKSGFGTKFQRSADNGVTYTSIAEIGDINGPDITKIFDDATNMESPDGFAESIAVGLHEAGNVTFNMAFIEGDTSQALLRTDNEAGTAAGYYRILSRDGTKAITMRGWPGKIGNAFPMRGKMVNAVDMKLTGKPVRVTL